MDILYIISPDHLSNIFSMVEDYQFTLQGYGSITNAINGLRSTNSIDIVGFCYVSAQLPTTESQQFKELIRLLAKIDMIGFQRKILFVSKIPGEVTVASLHKKFPRLKLCYSNVSEFSDKSIREQVFGSLLLGKYTLYQFESEKPLTWDHDQFYDKYSPIIPQSVFNVFGKVTSYGTLLQSLENDAILNSYSQTDPLYYLRRIVIARQFGEIPNTMMQQLAVSLEKAKEQLGSDTVTSDLIKYEFFPFAVAMIQGGVTLNDP